MIEHAIENKDFIPKVPPKIIKPIKIVKKKGIIKEER
jgi:hypothetical protein